MRQSIPETSELEAFLAVAEEHSFSAAAQQLGVPRATVSRRVRRLEERLDTRLFRRTSRVVAITDAGEELFPHARRVVLAAREVPRLVRGESGDLRGLVRFSTPPGSLPAVDAVVLDFMEAHPGVQVEVQRSTGQVDLLAGGFDVALRASARHDERVVARRLRSMPVRAWASAAYLEAHGPPDHPDSLRDRACLVGYERGERPSTQWPLLAGGHVRIEPSLASNDLTLLATAAARGLGIALLPAHFAARHDLRTVLPDHVGTTSVLALVYANRHVSPLVRAFVDHVWQHRDELLRAMESVPLASRGKRPVR